ncbi:MAG: alpha/beta hydrolase family protein [Paracoccaceae bacterium]
MIRSLAVVTLLAMTGPGLTQDLASHDNRIDLIRSDAPELAKPGALAVGVQTLEVVNPGQLDIVNVTGPDVMPVYDRPLTLEVWYPTAGPKPEAPQAYQNVLMRDGKRPITLYGAAVRDAAPDAAGGPYPLILISHGYPGNRFLMAHLGENLASKGYVTVAIDHTDSTYDNQVAFGSTLVNRPLDQKFVLNQIDALSKTEGSFLNGLVDAGNTGLIGYSMGGYGAVILAGGGVTEASTVYEWGAPAGTLKVHQAGSDTHAALPDPRIKAMVAFAPWGRNTAFWDAAGLANIRTPMMFIGGSKDDISLYEGGFRTIFEEAVNADRYLLTYIGANHNAGAPMPAPREAWETAPGLDFIPAEHYTDAVWDNVRMNNVAQHFTTAYFGKMLKADAGMDRYLALVEMSEDGVADRDEAGQPKATDTYWAGFPLRSAIGLRLEHRTAP